MAITEKTTHVSEALARLLEQFKTNPEMIALLTSWATQIQELEVVAFDVINGRGIDSAVGAQLDGIGQIIGEERGGAIDANYRLRLKARVLLNLSSGTIPQILEIFELLISADQTLALTEYYPASFRLEIEGSVSDDSATELEQILQQARAGGTHAALITSASLKVNTFTFGGVGATQGFGTGLLARVG